ncbi:MAG TPA: VWA domain-containing protein, partial [Dehalococcoidia bacterium]|nr:VWA domain-containing protein [Dehalococcoidia bacterium]
AGSMSFAEPEFFALLVVVALMGYIAVRIARWRTRARNAFAGPQASHWRQTFSIAATVFLLEAAALIVIAVARPVWGTNELTRERQGVDLVIVLDISSSMQATDATPTRLALAQQELTRLIDVERGSRIGLVFFAGSAVLRSPLTTDAAAVSQIIGRANREAGLTRTGSDIGAALDIAGRILETSTNAGKAVVIVSDGEDFGGTFASKAEALRQTGVTVFAAGAGTVNGAPLFEIDLTGAARPKLDKNGQRVISKLNEASLQQVAGDRGRYVHLGDGSLLDFRDDLAGLEQTPLGEELQKLPIERFQWFVGAAIVLLLAAWFLPARLAMPNLGALRLRPYGATAALLLMLVAGACGGGDSLRSRNSEANRLYNDGDFEGALTIYQELVASRPDLPELSYNAGNTLNRLGDFERAIEETRRALPPTSVALGSATYFSLGNHFLALNRLEEAFDAYRSALLINPNDLDAKYNLEVTLLLLANRQQDEQGQGDQPQDTPPGDQAGDPSPDGSPQPGATPPAGATPSAQATQRELSDALRGIDQDLSFEEAVRILDLLRQQQAEQQSQPSFNPGPDY